MEAKANPNLYNTLSIICGTWFLLTGWIWIYYANLFISFPVAAAGIFFWSRARKIDPLSKVNRTALVIHIVGLTLSVAFLAILLFNN